MINEIEIMKSTKSFAIIGASAKEESYGFNLVKSLTQVGYTVFPINPKYQEIYGLKTYKSLTEIEEEIENIVFAMKAENNYKVLMHANLPKSNIWFPPECWNEDLIQLVDANNLTYIKDKCPIGTYLKINSQNLKEDSDERI